MIDKAKPRFLDKDTSIYSLEPGAMTDAMNMTISVDGEGSGNVLNSSKGTNVIEPAIAIGNAVLPFDMVKGQVSDSQRGYIYFFVKGLYGDSQDCIRRFSVEDQTHEVVFRSDWLNLKHNRTVKIDVVNADFDQDGSLETILYFTDGFNPPRKINVERALDGEYSAMSNSELDIALSVMRKASTIPPAFGFRTNPDFEENSLINNQFQYATQIIYKDGEESALSPYSTLAVVPNTLYGAVEESGFGVDKSNNNFCAIKHQVDPDTPDIKSVRLLARNTNNGNFFIVDEFNPKESVNRRIFGVSTQVYNPTYKEYYFYNDRIGSVIDNQTALKTYNNVPFKALGQAIAGNRLMYSNYQEGRPNHPVEANITPRYQNQEGSSVEYISSNDLPNIFIYNYTANSVFNVELDLIAAAEIDAQTVIYSSSPFSFSFRFNPSLTVSNNAAAGVLSWDSIQVDNISGETQQVNLFSNEIELHSPSSNSFSYQTVTSVNHSASSLADFVQSELDEITVSVDYLCDFTLNSQYGNGHVFTDIPVIVDFKFGEDISATGTTITLKPRITNIKLNTSNYDPYLSGDFYTGLPWPWLIDPNVTDFNQLYSLQGDDQVECDYQVDSAPLSNFNATLSSTGVSTSFKAGANHAFGIVYYDKYGRCGFVNEIGNAYVKYPAERTTQESTSVSIGVSFDQDQNPPLWAESYQLVYGGPSVSSFFQYTVGGAYVKRTSENAGGGINAVDMSVRNIYVSLRTLDIYKSDKNVFRDYSFTAGDKLRIVSAKNAQNTAIEYPLSSQGKVMEFDVVGVVKDPEDLIHIDHQASHDPTQEDQDPHLGTFLVLSAPAVEGTSGNTDPLDINRYVGYDWYHLTNVDYNTSVSSSLRNFWNREVVVDIVTPKKQEAETIYYEIGERRRLGVYKDVTAPPHGPGIVTNNGNVWFRPVACKTPVYINSSSAWIEIGVNDDENPIHWDYAYKFIENEHITDLYDSSDWDKGRPHVAYKKAETYNRFNGVTWSDKYEEDVSLLSLSSFTPSTANFFSYDGKYGAINYIDNFNSDLLAIQENKFSVTDIGKQALKYADGSADVYASSDVISSTPMYYAGDYGMSSKDISSALVYNGQAFFADRSRRKILRFAGGQLTSISDTGMSSFFNKEIGYLGLPTRSEWKIISGYDPSDDMYYVTIRNYEYADPDGDLGTLSGAVTASYNVGLGKWQSQHSFYPQCYSMQDDTMYSFFSIYIQPSEEYSLMHSHDSQTNLSIYGSNKESYAEIPFNYNADSVKTFNAISVNKGRSPHTDSENWEAKVVDTSLGQSTNSFSLARKEGMFYSSIPRVNAQYDKDSVNSNIIVLGTISSVADDDLATPPTASIGTIYLSNDINDIYIPPNCYVNAIDPTSPDAFTNGLLTVSEAGCTLESVYRDQNAITIDKLEVSNFMNTSSVGHLLVAITNNHLNGDAVRGTWAKVRVYNKDLKRGGIYSVSAHFSNSNIDHSLNQQ